MNPPLFLFDDANIEQIFDSANFFIKKMQKIAIFFKNIPFAHFFTHKIEVLPCYLVKGGACFALPAKVGGGKGE
jgi:hypothetical protein